MYGKDGKKVKDVWQSCMQMQHYEVHWDPLKPASQQNLKKTDMVGGIKKIKRGGGHEVLAQLGSLFLGHQTDRTGVHRNYFTHLTNQHVISLYKYMWVCETMIKIVTCSDRCFQIHFVSHANCLMTLYQVSFTMN
jgi:hypothetical protein